MAAMKRTRPRWRLPSVPTGAVVAHARGDGQPGGGGAAIGEMARNFGAVPAGGARADAFDLAEPLDVGLELGRGLEVADDLGLDALDFLFQRPGQAGEAFGDEVSGGGFGAVAPGPEQGLEVGEAAHQFAQELLGGPGGLPAITNTGDGTGTGLQQSQLDKIKFYSDAGMTILPYAPGFAAFSGSLDEVVLVPEPSSVATVPGLLGLIAWRERRQVLPHENHEALTVMAARRT